MSDETKPGNALCGCADADRTYAEMEAHHLAEIERLREGKNKLAQTIAAFPDAHIAANIAHARADRDQLKATIARVEALIEELEGARTYVFGKELLLARLRRALDQPEPSPHRPGKFWDDLNENLKDPEFRDAYVADSEEIRAHDEAHAAFAERFKDAATWTEDGS